MADLSTLLEKEASTEIEAIVARANERAAEILAAARSEADSIVSGRERVVKAQREAGLVRARSAAQLEASALKLRAQHAGVERVFTSAREQLDALVGDPARYQPVFEKLLAQALETVGKANVAAVEVAPSDVEYAKRALGAKGPAAGDLAAGGLADKVEAKDDVRGGVRVRTTSRSAIENTLADRLEALEGELASEVSRALFDAAKTE